MLRSLFQFLFGSFQRKRLLSTEDKALIARMIDQAEAIGRGESLIDDKLPPPVIPERRKVPRV